ncbi:MAG: hypothetical protein J4G18_11145, partial [Anaerolineae bacterium]|nr:hypothetical protein [Anaerolineae bacterium]
MRSLPPQGFRNQSRLRPPAGYICVLRDVSYGDRYQIVRLENPTDIAPHLDQTFDVEIALVFQASDAGQSMREMLDFVGVASAGEWFDLDYDRFKSLRSLGTAGREHRRFSRPSNSLADLLAGSEPRAAQQPSAPRRRTQTSSAPRSQRSSAPASAARRQRSATPDPVPTTHPRSRNRRSKFIGMLFFLLLLGLLYQPLTQRDLIADIRSLKETVQSRAVTTQPQQVTSQDSLLKPIAHVASKSQTSVNFAWRAASGAVIFQYRYAVNDGDFSDWRGTDRRGIVLSDLEPGDRVNFELRMMRGGEHSPVTTLRTNTSPPRIATRVPLLRPSARVAEKSATSIRFEWDATRGASGYLYRYAVNNGGFSYWRSEYSHRFTLSNLEPGDRVSFELQALRVDERSQVTRLRASTLAAPTATSTPALDPTVTFTLNPEPSATNSPEPRATSTAIPEPSATHPPSETPTREPEPSATNSPEP